MSQLADVNTQSYVGMIHFYDYIALVHNLSEVIVSGVEKMVFFSFKFFVFLYKPKNLERSIFLVFVVFLDINFLRINFALKSYSYYFFIIILFSIYTNLHSL